MPETVRNYFGAITNVVQTFWQGMSVTLSHMLRRPITIQYPDRTEKRVADMLPARYRGFLEVDLSVCTGCLACARACPIDVIKISVDKDPANPKQRVVTQFDIDESKCMFCGLCVEPCPTGAIAHTREFESTVRSVDNLVFRWVPDAAKPAPFYRPVKGQDAPRAPVGSLMRAYLARQVWAAPAPDWAAPAPGKEKG
jgi:NADH-quinone oxidoreductase subunit I/NAD(P)H-quinone oxidoreductase subunit I